MKLRNMAVVAMVLVLAGCGGDDVEVRRGQPQPNPTPRPADVFERIEQGTSCADLLTLYRDAERTLWQNRRDPRAFAEERRIVDAATARMRAIGCEAGSVSTETP